MLSDSVSLETARNPFDGNRIRSIAREGDTIEEMIFSQGLEISQAYGVLVTINGEMVPSAMYKHIRPKAGTNLVLRVVPRGGDSGKGILSIILSILVVVAAIFAPQVGLLAAEGWAAVGAAGVALGGLMGVASGIQSLVAPPPTVPFGGAVPTSRDSAALTGTKNTARLYSPIRTVLGQYRVYPDLLAKPFSERVGKDSVLRMLLCFGYGPLDITDIKIGETPIDDIPGIRYNVLPGWDDDAALSLFRDDVDQDATFQPELKRTDGSDQSGGDTDPSAIEWRVLTTEPGPEEISIDIMFIAGLIAFSEDGGYPETVKVRFRIQERELGQDDTAWTNIGDPTMGVDYGDVTDTGVTKISAGLFEVSLAERGLVTRGFRWDVPSGSTAGVAHQVRIERVSTVSSVTRENSIFSDAKISVIRTIKPHVSSSIDQLAKIELEINASETGLSNVVDNLSALCTSIAPKWDSGTKTWGPTHGNASVYNQAGGMFKTRSAAWIFAQILRGPMNSRPISTDRIDGPSLAEWAGHLEGTGSYATSGTLQLARNIDAVIDYSSTTRQILQDIAGAGRASLNLIDGKYGVVEDIPRDQVIQHFSPRNSWGFSGAKAFRKKPHALRTFFVNPEKDYQKDERIVYADAYSEDGNKVMHLGFTGTMTPTSRIANGPGAGAWWTNLTASSHGGVTRLTTTGTDQRFRFAGGNLGIDTTGTENLPRYVRLKARRVSKGSDAWEGNCFFQTGTDSFTSAKRHQIPEPEWDQGWQWLVWDMQEPTAGAWMGTTIDRLRFDLTHGHATDGSVFEISELIVDDGTQEATDFAELSLWGVSDADQAWRDARYHMASGQLRPEIFTIQVDIEHLVVSRGDLVRISHDVIATGYGGARIKTVTNSGGAFVSATIDEEFVFDSSKSFSARIRTNDGNDLLVNLVNQGGTSTELVAESATSYGSNAAPAVGDLLLFGERETESLLCLVMRISPRNDLTALIELVEYNADVFKPETIPAHSSQITLQSSPTLLHPAPPVIVGDLVSDETALTFVASGAPEPRILVNVSTPQNSEGAYAPTTHFHAQFRLKKEGKAATDWTNAPRVEATGDTRIFVAPVEEGEVYDVRVRSISDNAATASGWVYANDHTVIGMSTPPDPPTELSVWGEAIRWNYGARPRDFAGFEIRHQAGSDSTWATGIPLTENLVTDNWVTIGGRIQPGETTIMVRAVDLSGNLSTVLSSVKNIRAPEDRFVVNSTTHTGIWANTKTNCAVDGGTNELHATTNSSDSFWPGGDTASFWSATSSVDFWGETIYNEMSYEGGYNIFDNEYNATWPAQDHLPGRQRISELEVEGGNYRIEYRALKVFNLSNPLKTYFTDWLPWPGERELEAIEYPEQTFDNFEGIYVRVTIAGGKTQGKLKKMKIITEAKPKTITLQNTTIPTSGYTADLTGLGWRGITNVTITPTNASNSAQTARIGEAYNLDAAQTSTAPYELTGPTIKLYNVNNVNAGGTATITLEGY